MRAAIAALPAIALCLAGASGFAGETASTNVAAAPTIQLAQLAGFDATFAQKAAQGGIAEVAAGQLAVQKASDQRVRSFAQKMIDDHGKANQELAALAGVKGVSIPAETDLLHQSLQQHLSGLEGQAFDRAYVQFQLEDHKKTIELFEREVAEGTDPDLQGFATTTLPTLRRHLSEVQSLYAQQGGA